MPRLIAALLAVLIVALVVPGGSAQAQTGGAYTPPPRGAPDGRVGGASRDVSAESRVALVIGNSAYRHVHPLSNPVHDADAMSETLRGLGFEVIAVDDADRTAMVKALGQFRKMMRADGVALFYYAGHGMQVRGRNFLLPVDADISDENDAALLAIDLDTVAHQMDDAGIRLGLYVLDACRDNPFERRFRSAGSRGLAPVDAARGSVIAFATAPGKTAADGDGEHGLFTGELLKNIVQPGLELEEVLKRTAAGVETASGNKQTPWFNSAFYGHFYFKAPVTVTVTPPAADRELAFWDAIKTSKDPADYEDFVKKYPNSDFASLARRRLASLQPSADVAAVAKARDAAEAQVAAMQAELAEARKKAEAAQTGLAETQKQLGSENAQHSDSQRLADTAANEEKELAARLATMQAQMKAVDDQLSAERKQREDALAQIAELNGRVKSLQDHAAAPIRLPPGAGGPGGPPDAKETQVAVVAPAPASAAAEGEGAWSLDDKREVQRALKALGHMQGEPDGNFGPQTRAAITQFQAFEGWPETGALSEEQRRRLLDLAKRVAAMLEPPPLSPSGLAAVSLRGGAPRLSRAASAEAAGKPGEATYWYRLAAADGEAKAFTNLGTMMVRGQGIDRPDPEAARLLWMVAGARGEPIALYDLGALYEHGIGVAGDIPVAKKWYARAAALGHPQAREALKRLGG